jgi:hypothetical protein
MVKEYRGKRISADIPHSEKESTIVAIGMEVNPLLEKKMQPTLDSFLASFTGSAQYREHYLCGRAALNLPSGENARLQIEYVFKTEEEMTGHKPGRLYVLVHDNATKISSASIDAFVQMVLAALNKERAISKVHIEDYIFVKTSRTS